MAQITKEFEDIELSSGKVVSVSVTITGSYESNYGADADGRRGVGKWMIDEWDHELTAPDDEELTEEEGAELSDKVEELVYEADLDFDEAQDEADDEDDDLF